MLRPAQVKYWAGGASNQLLSNLCDETLTNSKFSRNVDLDSLEMEEEMPTDGYNLHTKERGQFG